MRREVSGVRGPVKSDEHTLVVRILLAEPRDQLQVGRDVGRSAVKVTTSEGLRSARTRQMSGTETHELNVVEPSSMAIFMSSKAWSSGVCRRGETKGGQLDPGHLRLERHWQRTCFGAHVRRIRPVATLARGTGPTVTEGIGMLRRGCVGVYEGSGNGECACWSDQEAQKRLECAARDGKEGERVLRCRPRFYPPPPLTHRPVPGAPYESIVEQSRAAASHCGAHEARRGGRPAPGKWRQSPRSIDAGRTSSGATEHRLNRREMLYGIIAR